MTGALLIYCAGCFLALQPHMDSVAERIRRGLPDLRQQPSDGGGADGGAAVAAARGGGAPLPFVCGFSFGEQGPMGSGQSIHGNLMFNVLLFGAPKHMAAHTSSPGHPTPPSLPSSPRKASMFKRLRQYLLHPTRFRSMSQMLAEFDSDGDSTITPKEFHDTLLRFGFDISDEERAHLFDAIDEDGNGSISYKEMFVYLQRGA